MSDDELDPQILSHCTDAQTWVAHFQARFGGTATDQILDDDLLGWFANAIEAGVAKGYKQGARESCARELAEVLQAHFPLFAVVQLHPDPALALAREMVDTAIERYGLGRTVPAGEHGIDVLKDSSSVATAEECEPMRSLPTHLRAVDAGPPPGFEPERRL